MIRQSGDDNESAEDKSEPCYPSLEPIKETQQRIADLILANVAREVRGTAHRFSFLETSAHSRRLSRLRSWLRILLGSL